VVQKSDVYKEKTNEETLEKLREFCGEHLGVYKKPKLIEFMDEIPMTTVGKVDRKKLR
jgi:acyl-CoA synthetase (AMP-forming)/AMP-acid ligase II